ncbi:matrilin-3a isoform X3 [Fundulus heteroclitus]|uniref:matrilin-3a isoform X3 n=1 Tax=Fundulus heteroclitus TaxID=8078 RepID=UPI00165C19FA|nr:matrilin-3a isoform X3 [Fundulus heteroclitus]
MKPFPRSLLYCALLLFSDYAHATYHLRAGGPLITAQSYAQTRHNAQPVLRTLNPTNHRSDYTYRGRYRYHYQPPRIPPPVAYRPVPLSPPVTYHRPLVPVLPYHHRFNGPAPPHVHHIYKGLSPPVANKPHPQHRVKGPWPYKPIGPCPTKLAPMAPVVVLPTLPEPTRQPTFPATTVAPVTFIVTTASPVEIPALGTQPVSTQSGLITTVSPVETGLDPCSMGHDCGHICINSNASYYCKCRDSYVLNADKKTCSLKEVRAEVVEDPCLCEARLAFQKQTQAAIQLLTAKLADIAERIEHLENMLGRA